MPNLFLFLIAALSLNITPGPDMLYITARSLSQGRQAGIVSALGVGAGSLVHTAAAALGISALLMSSAIAYATLKYAGAAYLIYLGIRLLIQREQSELSTDVRTAGLLKIFMQGAWTNILNPKVALFYLAFLPQFVDLSAGGATRQLLLLGLIFNTTGTICNVIVGVLAGSLSRWAKRRPRVSQIQQTITGSLLIGMGVRVALPEHSR